ncbi:MAG: hypothetical protein R3A80_10735 [Bdellovibrionota bacterium]
MLSPQIWKGILILTLGHPTSLKPNGGVLWLSTRESVKVQSQVEKTILFPVKKDFIYLSGFNLGKSDPTPALITTSANSLALKRCANLKSLEIIHKKLKINPTDYDSLLENCAFDDLAFNFETYKNNLKFSEINSQFLSTEKKLEQSGLKITGSYWQNGKRHIEISTAVGENEILSKIPLKQRAFFEIELRNKILPGKNLIFELTLFEFSRNQARKLGLKWPQHVSLLSLDRLGKAQLNLMNTGGEQAEELALEADFGESQGVGKVIAQPTLRTQPGLESKFLSGGEFPVKSSNTFHSATTWKSYGLKISLTPSAEAKTGDTEVAVDFNFEFSEPNMEHAVDGTPSLFQRKLESRFDLRTNELTILTSMITLREGKSKAGLAFLNQVPLLSLLFSQESKLNTNSELWFALRPTWEEIPTRNTQRNLKYANSL